ncbi:MAG: response regulator [Rhodospirillaceae bacterium]
MADNDYTRIRALVVDDDDSVRRVVRMLLSLLGLSAVAEAKDGVSGLLEVLRLHPDIIFCDIHMKPLGGIAFLRQLRTIKTADLADTPVIMLTSETSPEAIAAVRELGANGYLIKPVSPPQLKLRIDAVLGTAPALAERIRNRNRI